MATTNVVLRSSSPTSLVSASSYVIWFQLRVVHHFSTILLWSRPVGRKSFQAQWALSLGKTSEDWDSLVHPCSFSLDSSYSYSSDADVEQCATRAQRQANLGLSGSCSSPGLNANFLSLIGMSFRSSLSIIERTAPASPQGQGQAIHNPSQARNLFSSYDYMFIPGCPASSANNIADYAQKQVILLEPLLCS
jgi:hypothetical protein